MAANWSLRRSIAGRAERVEDASERLHTYIERNNFIDNVAVTQLMREISANRSLSITRIQLYIDHAEITKLASEALLDVLNNEKKRLETQVRLERASENTEMKENAKESRKLELYERGNPRLQQWAEPPNDADRME